ncbi:Hint domain-containing protein, partial [Litoreibacter halocynthiae]|uniref:Hint domain-containing protein n=1 Tax=Litoreibacter halocynthiae TaxID=1242689 RepID=UPI002493B3B0
MPFLGIYSWSQYTTPAGIPSGDLTGDTTPNDPASPGYSSSSPSWIGETFTFNGGAPTQIDINDDDGNFEDGYVETGGAQTLAQAVTIDGTLYPAGSVVENEFSLINSSGQEIYVVRINGENVGFTYASGEDPTSGETFTAQQGIDGSPVDNADGTSMSSEPYADIVCFAAGTLIDTVDGQKAVETLQAGDLVMTLDQGPKPVLWLRASNQPLDNAPDDGKPVLISAGALGPGCPCTDLVVSPQHRIFVGGGQLGELFEGEALAPAKSLTRLPGIRHMRGKRDITWVHFSCEKHEVVFSNGCLTESLLLGPMVTNGMTGTERREVSKVFGCSPSRSATLNGPPARNLMTVQDARMVIESRKRLRSGDQSVQEWDWDMGLEYDKVNSRKNLRPFELNQVA